MDVAMTDVIVADIQRKHDEHFEAILRSDLITPPIKGEITRRKITYRKIKLHREITPSGMVSQLFQRGEPIGERFAFSFELKINTDENNQPQ